MAAYYVVSESLANTAKHASASAAEVEVKIDNGASASMSVTTAPGEPIRPRDRESYGLRDRVEAVGGSMVLASPPGEGTAMLAEFPLGILGGDRSGGRAEFAGPP